MTSRPASRSRSTTSSPKATPRGKAKKAAPTKSAAAKAAARRSPDPGPDAAELQELSLGDLRARRKGLIAEEERVSYWRRLVQFRLNLIQAERAAEPLSTPELLRSLGATGSDQRREQLLSLRAHEELPSLPGLADLWTAAIDPQDAEHNRRLVAALEEAEQTLSAYRATLHASIDATVAELIRRYRIDPTLIMTLIPA